MVYNMLNDFVKKHKILARKNLIKYDKQLKGSNFARRIDIFKRMALERAIINADLNIYSPREILEFIHETRHDGSDNCSDCLTITAELGIETSAMEQNLVDPAVAPQAVPQQPIALPTLGHLKEILENNANEEWSRQSVKPTPTGLERWALKAAVSDYYNSLSQDSALPVIDAVGSLRTKYEFAPNKESIYRFWIAKLDELKRLKLLDPKRIEQSTDRGIPRGGAFEKQLDRYRSQFMNQLNMKR